MKKFFCYAICTFVLWSTQPYQMVAKKHNESFTLEQVNELLKDASSQATLMANELKNKPGALPRTLGENGNLIDNDYGWWCCGFFPGTLWLLSESQPENKKLREYAEMFTWRVGSVRNVKDNHDIGFMLNCSFGQAYRITGDQKYLPILFDGARNLSSRFMPKAGVTLSWNPNKKWKAPVIIDNMMNLELLEVVGKMQKNTYYLDIADSHAQTTIKNHYRPNYSTWHVIDYDPETGDILHRNTAQGFSDDSDWARGQAWGLYGYTMMYRETGNKLYLKQAKKVAKYLFSRTNMPEDLVPYWDYDCPDIPNTVRDASSAAIMASALIELSTLDKSCRKWRKVAEKQLRSLSSSAYRSQLGTNHGFILMHSTGSKPGNSEVDVPLSYADYYYVEALMRLKKLLK